MYPHKENIIHANNSGNKFHSISSTIYYNQDMYRNQPEENELKTEDGRRNKVENITKKIHIFFCLF